MSIIEPVQKSSKELEELRLNCKRNHWWEPCEAPDDFERSGRYLAARYINHWQCQKCHSFRHDGLRANGGVLIRRYSWVDGYLRDKDEEAPTSDEVRLWIAKRNRTLGIGGRALPVKAPEEKPKKKTLSEQLRATG